MTEESNNKLSMLLQKNLSEVPQASPWEKARLQALIEEGLEKRTSFKRYGFPWPTFALASVLAFALWYLRPQRTEVQVARSDILEAYISETWSDLYESNGRQNDADEYVLFAEDMMAAAASD